VAEWKRIRKLDDQQMITKVTISMRTNQPLVAWWCSKPA
jgi:hypothetical protein